MNTTVLLPPLDYREITQNFIAELEQAEQRKPSSLSYHVHNLSQKPIVTEGIIKGIVIGGTNYIVSTQHISSHGKVTILEEKTGILPLLDLSTLISFLREHKDDRAVAVGLNFGFGMTPRTGPFGEMDGVAVEASKEHSFTGILGKDIGDIVRQAFAKNIPVAVANDTICLALAGDGTESASLIAGTGFNLGIVTTEQKKKVVINIEAGNFNKFPHDEELRIIDAQSEIPGAYLFEKVISGKYLATFFNAKAKSLGISHSPLTTSQELSKLSHEINDAKANQLARAIMERSAFLVAAAIAGLYKYREEPDSFTIIGEGSLLWLGWGYKENIYIQLKLLGIPENAVTIRHVKDSSINGAFGLLTK